MRSRRILWGVAATLCVIGGVLASLLGAHAVARKDAATASQAFPRTSTAIASTLKLALQHEEDLAVGAGTFFAGNPRASGPEFDTWVKWAQVLHRYPELQTLSFIELVRAPELASYEARISGHTLTPAVSRSKLLSPKSQLAPETQAKLSSSGSQSKLSTRVGLSETKAAAPFRLPGFPIGGRSYYCFASVQLSRPSVKHAQPGVDYCASTSGLLSSRDSTQGVYARAGTGRNQELAVEQPVYRGNLPPSSLTGRRAAFAGWLREVLVPGVLLRQILRDHAGYAVRLRYTHGPANILFTSSARESDTQSRAIDLHNGWTVKVFAPASADAGVFADGDALRVLIGGLLLSLLLGLLVFLIGGGRAPATTQPIQEAPNEELYDGLTGLPNRALMLDRCERMLARATRQSGLLVGALFIDIDWFADVNEKLGEAAGDQLLSIVAERLEKVVRTHDSVGRLDGDEFVVLVESAARGVRLDSLARRVIEALHKPVELDGFRLSFTLTASIGVAFGRYATPEDLLRDAQLALTAAKSAGRDRYTLFNANMRSIIEGRGVLEVELNTALQEKQFVLFYQPVYDLSSQSVVGLEALIRWQHPTQGLLAPADFIPLAEETGLIVPIGRWALEEACSRAATWNLSGRRVDISVKVSANQLNRDGFITDVRRALQQSGIEPSLLVLEIAETTVMRDVAAAARRLEEIKHLGVRIAIDEFGSGYAHHSDLQQMPLDFLKVDRSSLAASDDEDYRSWFLQAILAVGRDLSLPVIATGIETHEQMTMVEEMGCPMAQGFLLGEPAPLDAVEKLFDADFPTAPATAADLSRAAEPAPSTGAWPTDGALPPSGSPPPGAGSMN